MFEIKRYTPADKAAWDGYVARSKNATFLFLRDYMDYHADRFRDHSLLFYLRGRLYALLPAHVQGQTLRSHGGLTYGGLIMDERVTLGLTVTLFAELSAYLRRQGIAHVVYSPIPWVYHRLPAEEDLYAMFWQCHPVLTRRMSGTAVDLAGHLPWRKDHRRRLRKAHECQVEVRAGAPLREFWPLLEANLARRFQTKPVHTLSEILLLQSRFPQEIVQYSAYIHGEIVGGVTFYLMGHVLHGQYSATNDQGKAAGAMEAIYEQVVCHDFLRVRYLEFGTSNEQGGRVLNEGLTDHKEAYGARTIVYDTYEWDTDIPNS